MAAKGVIVEFDFAAMNGADMLFETTKAFLAKLDGIPYDDRIEAQHMAGGNYQGAFAEYFQVVKTKKTAAKAAKDFSDAFGAALDETIPSSVSQGFRNFVKALSGRGVKVVIATRADIGKAALAEAFANIVGPDVVLYHEESTTYGCVKWDVWRRACAANNLRPFSTLAVTGSGNGVKSALLAGMPSMVVVNPRTAYQDCSGADAVVKELNADSAKEAIEILRV